MNVKDIDRKLEDIAHNQEERVTKQKAQNIGLDYVNLVNYQIAVDVLRLIPIDIVKRLQLVAYIKVTGIIKLATPNITREAIQYATALGEETKSKIVVGLCSQSSFVSALSLYMDALEEDKKHKDEKEAEVKKQAEFGAISSLDRVATLAKTISTTDLVSLIFSGAVGSNASDVHIEAQEHDARLRYRIDGVLQDVVALNQEQYKAVVSRIKNLARLKLDVKTAPQDGRFSITAADVALDLRVSTIPSAFGEAIVMRLLRQDVKFVTLEQLGFSPQALSLIQEAISKPHGMVLNTGPTGSGKTTTLYAILSKLNNPEVKIITIEDPIEYRISGINQTQVNTENNYTFANALRSVVRQDPDIVMVGEIRDTETAQIALQAALTGHLLLSTLHTNNAASAIPRLLEMGIEPFLLAGSINLIIAQRLVRLLCGKCRGKGCDNCNKTGFKGRLPIIEILKPTHEFNELIARKASVEEFERKAIEQGMVTMYQDGMNKVGAGLTIREEVERVTLE